MSDVRYNEVKNVPPAGAPIVVTATWVGMLTSARAPTDAWAVLIAGTLVLAGGWALWLRVVRRLGSGHMRANGRRALVADRIA